MEIKSGVPADEDRDEEEPDCDFKVAMPAAIFAEQSGKPVVSIIQSI